MLKSGRPNSHWLENRGLNKLVWNRELNVQELLVSVKLERKLEDLRAEKRELGGTTESEWCYIDCERLGNDLRTWRRGA